jgi:uncharacterized membrane protein
MFDPTGETAMLPFILGLILFLGIHSVRIIVPEWRERQLAAMGEARWKGIYSLISIVGLVLMIWWFRSASAAAPILYEPPVWLKHIAVGLMFLSFVSLAVFILPAGRLKPILGYPLLASVNIWAFAHLLANGDLASLMLFGAFLVWAVADLFSISRRGEMTPKPGPIKWDVYAVAVGVVLSVLVIWKLHLWLIGVPPIA